MNVSSVSKAHLEFVDDRTVGEGLMGQILPALQNVKRLTLSHSCIKVRILLQLLLRGKYTKLCLNMYKIMFVI